MEGVSKQERRFARDSGQDILELRSMCLLRRDRDLGG